MSEWSSSIDGGGTILTSGWTEIEKFFGINGHTTASTTGMTPAQVKTVTGAATLQNVGVLSTILGGLNSAVGSYFAAQSQQYQYKSQALSLGYQADMAAINARAAEYSAESSLEAGKSQIERLTLQEGQQKASSTAAMASRGIALGQGSAAEVTASQDVVKDIDMYTISANATREAALARTQATSYRNQSLMDRTGAVNAKLSADSVSPFSAVSTSLINTATSVANQWNNKQRLKAAMAGGYYGSNYSAGGPS
jgi:hypothetical protein